MDLEFEKLLKIAAGFVAVVTVGAATDFFLCRDYEPQPKTNPVVGIVNGMVANSMNAACKLFPWR